MLLAHDRGGWSVLMDTEYAFSRPSPKLDLRVLIGDVHPRALIRSNSCKFPCPCEVFLVLSFFHPHSLCVSACTYNITDIYFCVLSFVFFFFFYLFSFLSFSFD